MPSTTRSRRSAWPSTKSRRRRSASVRRCGKATRDNRMSDEATSRSTINGAQHAIRVEPRRTLADAIREDCGQTGTHIGCEHGVCGACTVLVDGAPVRSCLMFAVQADGSEIRTVEGLAQRRRSAPAAAKPSWSITACNAASARRAFSCWPPACWSASRISATTSCVDVLSSNLCRCTGYQNIIKAVRAAAARNMRQVRKRVRSTLSRSL